MKTLNQYEQEALKELREVQYQGYSLIYFVIKCIEERNMGNVRIGDTLYKLHCSGKIQITPNATQQDYFKLIVAHYENLHNERNVRFIVESMKKHNIKQAQIVEDLALSKGDLSAWLSLTKPLPIGRFNELTEYFNKLEIK